MNDKIHIFSISIDKINMEESISTIFRWINNPNFNGRYIVTPNVDHIVKLRKSKKLQTAYNNADMVVADGKPILLASILCGQSLPCVVPGSDLTIEIFNASKLRKKLNIFLLGAALGVGDKAAENIKFKWPWINVSGVYSPPFGFETDNQEIKKILSKISTQKPDLLLVGLGAPKQEVWVSENSNKINAKVVLCAGATIDFLGKNVNRAPLFMRQIGLEWFYRFIKEPRRLFKRYFIESWIFLWLLIKEIKKVL